jgi:hypothetical protein
LLAIDGAADTRCSNRKAPAEPHLPLMALDCRLRATWPLDRKEFPAVVISPEQRCGGTVTPVLVAPLFGFHPPLRQSERSLGHH